MKILVTGGAGFIGSAVCRYLIRETEHCVVNVDKLTYAANLASLEPVARSPRYAFQKLDIVDSAAILDLMRVQRVDAIMHLAAESHVDRSIDGPQAFINTNIVGTYSLLEAARTYWSELPATSRANFRFHHVSTDEVYGDLPFDDSLFHEESAYRPSSPYSASKAASDHLVLAWMHTFGLPVVISNCSNNYGPYHFPEKLIPLTILNALSERKLPVYGRGENVRDWLYVDDHAEALHLVLSRGEPGRRYNIGGRNEMTNIEVVRSICHILDRLRPRTRGLPHEDLIEFVTDRPGHDRRYAIDASRIETELGWKARHDFRAGIEKTVRWYLDNEYWWRPLRQQRYNGERLGGSLAVGVGPAAGVAPVAPSAAHKRKAPIGASRRLEQGAATRAS